MSRKIRERMSRAILAGALVLGPRLGRFSDDGKSIPMPGHNIAFAALGVFILWFGWFGFNPGSELAATGGSTSAIAKVALTTNLSAAAGAVRRQSQERRCGHESAGSHGACTGRLRANAR